VCNVLLYVAVTILIWLVLLFIVTSVVVVFSFCSFVTFIVNGLLTNALWYLLRWALIVCCWALRFVVVADC